MDQCLKQMLCHNRTVVAIVLLNPFSIFGSLSLSPSVCVVFVFLSIRDISSLRRMHKTKHFQLKHKQNQTTIVIIA